MQRHSCRHLNRAHQVGLAVSCCIQITHSKVSTAACRCVGLYDSSQSWQMLQSTTGAAVLGTVLQHGPNSSAAPDVVPEGQPQNCASALTAEQEGLHFCTDACCVTWRGTDTQPPCCRDSVRGDRYGGSRSSRDGRSDRDYRCTAMSLPRLGHCHVAAALRQKARRCSCMAVACPRLALHDAHGQMAGAGLMSQPPPHSTRHHCACCGPAIVMLVLVHQRHTAECLLEKHPQMLMRCCRRRSRSRERHRDRGREREKAYDDGHRSSRSYH